MGVAALRQAQDVAAVSSRVDLSGCGSGAVSPGLVTWGRKGPRHSTFKSYVETPCECGGSGRWCSGGPKRRVMPCPAGGEGSGHRHWRADCVAMLARTACGSSEVGRGLWLSSPRRHPGAISGARQRRDGLSVVVFPVGFFLVPAARAARWGLGPGRSLEECGRPADVWLCRLGILPLMDGMNEDTPLRCWQDLVKGV